MTKSRWMLILSGLAALALSANLALAKGPWGKVEISGDGLVGVVEITDPQLLEGFSLGAFQDLALGSIDPPQVIGSGYKMRRGGDNEKGVFMPFDVVHYYLDPAGGPGYLYYDGLVNGGSEFDRNWYRVTPTGEAAMQQFFATQGIQPDTTGQVPARVLSEHTEAVTELVWSPDGSRLASSAGWWDSKDFGVRLWSADGIPIQTLYGHSAPVQSITWSPDSAMLATGSHDGAIRLWSADGDRIDTIEAEKGQVIELSWSPDGDSLVSVSIDETGLDTIQEWSIAGELLNTTTSDTGSIFLKVVWPTNDDYILAGGLGYHEPNADGKLVFTPRKCQSCTPYWGFAWSPEGQMWAIGNESGNVSVYHADGTWIDDMQNEGNVDTLDWSPDGTTLAGGNSIWLWNGKAFERQGGISAGRIAALDWSPDGSTIATAASNFNQVRLWDTTGKPLRILSGHRGNVQALRWSPDSTQLASGAADGTIRLWNVSGEPAPLVYGSWVDIFKRFE